MTVVSEILRGDALAVQGRITDAIKAYQAALALDPGNMIAQQKLALAMAAVGAELLRQRQFPHAENFLRRANKWRPGQPDILNNLAASLSGQRRYAEAEPLLRQALALLPNEALVHGNLGMALVAQGKFVEAEPILRRALALQPGNADPACHLVTSLVNQGKQREASQLALQLLAREPEDVRGYSALLYALTFDADLPPEQYLAQARIFGRAAAKRATPFTQWKDMPDGQDRMPLRVGFVSGDLRLHPVGYFLEGFIAAINPARVQLIAYNALNDGDELTDKLKPLFAEWHDISALDDSAAATKIHSDGIHVLIDLSGHTTHNRLPMFAWKPAPVQVSWLGYSASTGLQAVDWLIVDKASTPDNADALYSEKLWCLPSSRICFTPPPNAPAVSSAPSLANGYVTFGSFQNMPKIGDNMLALWARILAAVPSSKLRVQNGELGADGSRERFLQRAESFGIPRDRVITAGRMPREAYLAAHAEVDFILDTYPYPGGTTTCEALWMGVPTLVRAGRTLLSRYGASVLAACELTDWIAESDDEYIALAVRHASNPRDLEILRMNLREQVRHSPLCDSIGFARRFEEALHGMWRTQRITH